MKPLYEKTVSGAPITILRFHPDSKMNMAWCSYPSSIGRGTIFNWLDCRDIRQPDLEAYGKEQRDAMSAVQFAERKRVTVRVSQDGTGDGSETDNPDTRASGAQAHLSQPERPTVATEPPPRRRLLTVV